MSVNDTNDEVGSAGATISAEEFRRLQEQLLELRNRNYELLEENQRQQKFINILPTKSTEALFASKFLGRRKDRENICDKLENEIRLLQHKLSSQEEEFRLQQSTLLSELNKVVKHCDLLEEKAKEHSGQGSKELTVRNDDIEKLTGRNWDLQMEVSSLKGMLAEKDVLLTEIKILNQDLLSAKKVLDEEINMERQRSTSLYHELEEVSRKVSSYMVLLNEKEDELTALRKSYTELMGRASTSDKLLQTDDLNDLYGVMTHAENSEEEGAGLHEVKNAAVSKGALLGEVQKSQDIFGMESQTTKAVVLAIGKKQLVDEALCGEGKEQFYGEVERPNLQPEELQCCKEKDCKLAAQNFEAIRAALEAKIKEDAEEIRKKDEEIKVVLKKQSSMVKELRRQVQSEKKRAEQAEKRLNDVLGVAEVNVYSQNGSRIRLSGSPSIPSDRSKGKIDAEVASSICSWAFVVEPDKNSLQNFDGEESSCSASLLENDNAELIGRLVVLQKKHAEVLDRLNMVEEENVLLKKENVEKSEVITQWIRSLPDISHNSHMGSSSPGLRLRRVLGIVGVDESVADIRDMNRRLQRMLEEALSKNLLLEKNIQTLLEKN